MIEAGKFNLPKVDLIDITTEAGFPWIEKLGLQKVPAAFKNGKACKILSDDESLMITCEGDDNLTDATQESPAGESA
jgi:hypothetical protein